MSNRLTIAGISAVLIAMCLGSVGRAAGVPSKSTAPTVSDPTSNPEQTDDCQPLTVTKTTYMTTEGVPVAASAPDTATVYHLELNPGDDIRQVVPPIGFNPLTASDKELQVLGLPSRPTDSAISIDAWTKMWAGFKGFDAGGSMCVMQKSAPIIGSFNEPNWAGVEASLRSDYRRAQGQARVPASLNGTCPDVSNLSLWVGVGGNPGSGLLQNGVSTYDLSYQSMFAWWEAISPSHDTQMVDVAGSWANPGDLTYLNTYYSLNAGNVQFTWYNLTTGNYLPTVYVSSYAGEPISGYYDGTTAEFIDERAYSNVTHGFEDLRAFGYLGWKEAYVARAQMADHYVSEFPYSLVEMYGSSGTHLAGLSGGALAGPGNWNVHWLACK